VHTDGRSQPEHSMSIVLDFTIRHPDANLFVAGLAIMRRVKQFFSWLVALTADHNQNIVHYVSEEKGMLSITVLQTDPTEGTNNSN
jgi:hypothetical protein